MLILEQVSFELTANAQAWPRSLNTAVVFSFLLELLTEILTRNLRLVEPQAMYT